MAMYYEGRYLYHMAWHVGWCFHHCGTTHKHPSYRGPPQDCKYSFLISYTAVLMTQVASSDHTVLLTDVCSYVSMLVVCVCEIVWVGVVCSLSLNLSRAHIPSVHTFVVPPGQVPSNRALLNAVQSEVSMRGWCV